MLARNNQKNALTNPFGLQQQRSQSADLRRSELQAKQKKPERNEPLQNNKNLSFRYAGNACEIAAGACLNSAVVFTVHLLQIHPAGMILALGISHFYLTATATGARKDKRVTNLMTGASATIALLCALSEPIEEWWEANQSKNHAISENIQMYEPVEKQDLSGVLTPVVVAVLIGILTIWIISPKHTKN
ncbi:hypothetical protein LC593_14420 [Nostoc sp. CHAB 5844]|nr:hypothetical protein [Nostoc sp. CHAB 5844]